MKRIVLNLIGPGVVKYRHLCGWSQEKLARRVQLLGCYMTRDMVANTESQRSTVTDIQASAYAEALGVNERDLFPEKRIVVQSMLRIDELSSRRRVRKNASKKVR